MHWANSTLIECLKFDTGWMKVTDFLSDSKTSYRGPCVCVWLKDRLSWLPRLPHLPSFFAAFAPCWLRRG